MANENNQLNFGITFCSTSELNTLKRENELLLFRISELTKDKDILQHVILNKDKTIDELKEENKKLNNRISELENNLFLLKDRLNRIENKSLYNKYMIAIQDINSLEQLEQYQHIGNDLKRLRRHRIGDCHYIDMNNIKNDPDFINDQRFVLFEKIDNMPFDIMQMFNKKYPNLLNNIKPYIINNTFTKPIQQNYDDILEWWS